ncbi:hypothetical protein MKW92_013101, partial [Papaver armeniacum]
MGANELKLVVLMVKLLLRFASGGRSRVVPSLVVSQWVLDMVTPGQDFSNMAKHHMPIT